MGTRGRHRRFFKSPPNVAPKPRISGFNTAQFDEIAKLAPDLIITFSDVQASLAAELMRRGFGCAPDESTDARRDRDYSGTARADRWP